MLHFVLEPREQRLPTNEEIARHRGFPSPEEEAALMVQFFKYFALPAKDLAKTQVPAWEPTPNQMHLYLCFLYGIFFYNFVSHGRVLNGSASCNDIANAYRQVRLDQEPLTKKLLPLDYRDPFSWPLHLSNDKEKAWALASGIIGLGVRSIDNLNPFTVYAFSPKQPAFLRLLIQFSETITATKHQPYFKFTSVFHLKWILTGIEEAQHVDFDYLERLHYNGASDKQQLLPKGPLQTLKPTASTNHNLLPNDRQNIEYNALIGNEYAAHIVKMKYIQLYYPELWQMGYKNYDKLVRSTRRQKLKVFRSRYI